MFKVYILKSLLLLIDNYFQKYKRLFTVSMVIIGLMVNKKLGLKNIFLESKCTFGAIWFSEQKQVNHL